MTLDEKYNKLFKQIKKLGKVVVAYSGGVDSNFLLRACVEAIGPENVLACISANPSLPKSQYDTAISMAGEMKVSVDTIYPAEMEDEKFIANNADRCFHCKSHLFKTIRKIAEQKNFQHILCGNNFDDLDDYRPGSRAGKLLGVLNPLVDAELTKDEIRQLSKKLNLATAEIPASPCLASRVNYGSKITEEKLKQIEDAEEFLKTFGLTVFRLRHHSNVARIEVNPEDIAKLVAEPVRMKIVDKIKSLGFDFVTIDLQGFRSGAMNEALSQQQKQQ